MKKLIGISTLLVALAGSAMAAPASVVPLANASDGTEQPLTKVWKLVYTSSTFPTSASALTVNINPRGSLKVFAYDAAGAGTPSVTIIKKSAAGDTLQSVAMGATTTGSLTEIAMPNGFSRVTISPTTVPTSNDIVSVTVINAVTK